MNITRVTGIGPLLPAGPRGFAGSLGVPPNQPLHGSGGPVVQVPPVRPRLGLPPERPPGESNIHGAPMLPHGSFVPQGTPRAPLTVPHLGIPTNPVGKVVSAGVPPVSVPPVQLIGNGSPRATPPLLNPAVRPIPPQVSYMYIMYCCIFHGESVL